MPKPRTPTTRFIAARFGKRLKELRGDHLSQAALAERSGVSAEQVSQLERGESQPTLSTMLALQEALELPTLEELIDVLPAPSKMPSLDLWHTASAIKEPG